MALLSISQLISILKYILYKYAIGCILYDGLLCHSMALESTFSVILDTIDSDIGILYKYSILA